MIPFYQKPVKKELEEMRNTDLLHLYLQVNIAFENCLRMNHNDAHEHLHYGKEIEQVILERMHAPDVVKIKVK